MIVIVVVIFRLMSGMVVVVKAAWPMLMVFLVPGMAVREAVTVLVNVFVKMVVLELPMS
ncbi:MAG: hypothetical protein JRE65_14690, partial [Deltaproteobacteria bacterium]|nr:hypothetical protein [Deltaproteobacteria bacterium]